MSLLSIDRPVASRVRSWLVHPRLLLAVKTGVAVAIAWLIAPYMPGVVNDYPYYAPLGALISMSPTLMSSLKTGAQTLAALTIGILLAAAILYVSEPNVISISLVVGVGVLIAGSRWLTTGGDYVAVAALFVLIVGGPDADSYSIGYLVQMTVGIVVGLAVNMLVLPPLNISAAVVQLARFRSQMAAHLRDIAAALVETWPPEHEEWAGRAESFTETSDRVRAAVRHADDSRKLNPRARLHRRDLNRDYEDLAALETMTFHVRDLSGVLTAAIWEGPFPAELPHDLREPLSDTLRAIADVLIARNDSEDLEPSVAAAEQALDTLVARLDEHRTLAPSSLTPAATVALDLRRILAIIHQSGVRSNEVS
ncbi:MAG: aromatic acid exporter family protein [Mycetocola sp.]